MKVDGDITQSPDGWVLFIRMEVDEDITRDCIATISLCRTFWGKLFLTFYLMKFFSDFLGRFSAGVATVSGDRPRFRKRRHATSAIVGRSAGGGGHAGCEIDGQHTRHGWCDLSTAAKQRGEFCGTVTARDDARTTERKRCGGFDATEHIKNSPLGRIRQRDRRRPRRFSETAKIGALKNSPN